MKRRTSLFITTGLCAVLAASLAADPRSPEKKRFRETAELGNDQQPADLPENAGVVQFEGTRTFKDEELRAPLAETLREIGESGLNAPRADDAAYFLTVFYRKQGYADAEVKHEIRGSRLILQIHEGPRAYLGNVKFIFPSGKRHYDDATLYSYMVSETKERPKKNAPALKIPYVDADLDSGIGRVRGFYESEGYLKVSIARTEEKHVRMEGGAKFIDVKVAIVENEKYLFGHVSFLNPPRDGGDFTTEKLISGLGNPTGEEQPESDPPPVRPLEEAFTIQRANTMQHNLAYYLKLHGFYEAKVDLDASEEKAVRQRNGEMRVPVTFTIHAGKLYRFDGVKVTNVAPENEPKYKPRLRANFLPHRFAPLNGQVYDPRKLDERYREVLKTGLFKRLRMTTMPLRDSDEVEIDLEAEEAKAREIGFTVGFSSYEGAMMGVRLADRNFMGNGRPLSLEINYTLRGLGLQLQYFDPWWLESDFALRAKLFAEDRTEVGYSKQDSGFRADISRKLNPKTEYSVFAAIRNVNVTESEIPPELLGPTSYQIATLGITQTLDYRNNPLNPSRGWIWNVGMDVDAIAGAVSFGRATTRLSYYLPIKKKFLFAAGLRGGVIYPLADVPIDERFFNGGATTVRSFRERRLGPMDKGGHPIGGEAYTVFNAEFTFPIKDALKGAVFCDAGNLIGRVQDFGVSDMRFALGVGLRYDLPVGPVRLDVGFNPNPKRDEDWGAVQFSFGFAF